MPEAILRAASLDPVVPVRHCSHENTSPNAPTHCAKLQGLCILNAQSEVLANIVEQSKASGVDGPLSFWITNNMHDETKLPLYPRNASVLARHSQVTWKRAASARAMDLDVIRTPRRLKHYRATTVWNLLAEDGDSAGILPRGGARPVAKFYGYLTAQDSHSVNTLLSKNIAKTLLDNEYHMASYCTQHRTGSTCEEVSKKWNMLPPSFCLAKQLGDAQFHADLTEAVRDLLRKYLHVTEQAPELDSEGLRLSEFARELLFSCYVDQQSDNQEHSEAEQTLCEARRKKEAEQFLAFFSPPWCGVIRHLCPVGCCGPLACSDRVKSIDKGTDLIMKIILPRLTVPAANRYTKIFPVVTSICLMLHFFKISRRH